MVFKAIVDLGKKIAKGAKDVGEGIFGFLKKIVTFITFLFDLLVFIIEDFPQNIVCGIILIFLYLFNELVKNDVIADIVNFLIHIIPYIVKLAGILIVYGFRMAGTGITQVIEVLGIINKQQARNLMVYYKACNSDPRQRYMYAQNHVGNAHSRHVIVCMKPCRSGYVPHLGGYLCKKPDFRIPVYCPKAIIMRALESLEIKGSSTIGNGELYHNYLDECKNHTIELTDDETNTRDVSNLLLQGVCQQANLMVDNPQNVYSACHQTFCKNGNREPFCSRVDPEYVDNMDMGVRLFLQIPGLIAAGFIIFYITKSYSGATPT